MRYRSVIALWAGLGLALGLATAANAAPFRYAEWDLGSMPAAHRHIAAIARVMRYFDLVCVQGPLTGATINRLRTALNRQSSAPWHSLASVADPSGNKRVPGVFFWRASRLAFDGATRHYRHDADVFAFPPFSAQFRDLVDHSVFTASDVAVTPKGRTHLAVVNQYWLWLEATGNNTRIVMGTRMPVSAHARGLDALTHAAVPIRSQHWPGQPTRYTAIWRARAHLSRMPRSGIFTVSQVLSHKPQWIQAHIAPSDPLFSILDMGSSQ